MTDHGVAPDRDVIVVGGGVAGLVAALGTAQLGYRTTVLEADAQPGGCVRLHTVGGLALDRGADSFATARPAVGDLVRRLGLPVQRPAAAPAWVRHTAGADPLPGGSLLGIPSDPSSADVRRVIGRAGSLRAALDRLLPAGYGASAGFGPLVRRRMGRRVLQRLVEPVVGGVYSTDPADLDVDATAPGLRAAVAATGSLSAAVARLRGNAPPAGSAVAGIVGGMGTLATALAAAVVEAGGEIRCGQRVTGVHRAGSTWVVTAGHAGTVTAGHAGAVTMTAAQVVLAVPAGAARALLSIATDGALLLPAIPASPVLLATLVLDDPALDAAPRGTGVLVSPRVPAVAAKALTHATAKWEHLARAAGPGRHVLRLSYGRGGAAPPEGSGSGGLPDDADFPDLALADAADLLGLPLRRAQLVDHAVVRYPDQLAAKRLGQAAAVREVRERLVGWPGLLITGSAVAGTGLAAVVTDATTVPGAVTARAEGRMGS